MYDELVKDLREKAEFLAAAEPLHIKNAFAETMKQAADAIEDLNKLVENSNKAYKAVYQNLAVRIPRWISVEERLPEAECGDFSKNVLVTDGKYIAISSYFNCEEMEPYWCYTGIGEITHWMPLPEPPKEEEQT